MKRLMLVGLIALMLTLPGVASENSIRLPDATALQFYMRWTPGGEPLISAHRGGPEPGYPENCLETFQNALTYGPCIIECDVARTADSVLVMMHDDTVDRTTTGTGDVNSLTFEEIRALNLLDNDGNPTPFKVPTFGEVLDWAKNNAILTVDVKRTVSHEEVVAVIEEHEAESCSIVITYNLDQAARVHKLNPDLMLSVTIRNQDEWERTLASGIQPPNIVAFVGVGEPELSLYSLLHENGVRTILGTMGNLDRKADKRGPRIYYNLYKNGADILSTDRVPAATEGIEMYVERELEER
ncbi:glycerophosphodiester phosphodiesterase family protein [bacterium]|nr:glycerophosphodiester phosphodiesterase family protein [bacterium]